MLEASKNLMYLDWVNTNAVIRHPSAKVFVSHGGLNSFFEAMLALVPVIVVPKAGDQFHNCKLVHARMLGRCVEELDSDRIVEAALWLDGNSLVRAELERAREALLLQEVEEEGDFKYWLDNCAHGGCKHLQTRYARELSKY